MISKAQLYKGKVYIYYHSKDTCRIPTGIAVGKKHFSPTKYILKSSDLPDYKECNRAIFIVKKKIDDLILSEHQNGTIPTGKSIRNLYLKKYVNQSDNDISALLMYHFDEFIKFKANSAIANGTLIRLRSLRNAVKDFETDKSNRILISDIDTDWLQTFEIFLSEPRSKESLTKGNLNDNTIHKRFKDFRQFWKYMVNREIISENRHLRDYKIQTHQKDAIALTKEDLVALKNYTPKSDRERKTIDLFLFCCFTGMRYSDAVSLKKSNIEGNMIRKTSQKTKGEFEVGLTNSALDILERNNFNMKLLSSQKLNSYIKEIAKSMDLFHRKVREEVPRRGKILVDEVPLWTKIGSHTARRTFTDLLAGSNVSPQKIMRMTGHQSLDTVNKYLQKRKKVSVADLSPIDL